MSLFKFLFVTAVFLVMPIFVRADVLINEIAWMGTFQDPNGSYCEWIEIYNSGTTSVNIENWELSWGTTKLIFNSESGAFTSLEPNSFYVIERLTPTACPDPVPGVDDWSVSFGSGISNSGAIISLNDASGNNIDQVDGGDGWGVGGNASTKDTLQRTDSGWVTAQPTPKSQTITVSSDSTVSTNEQTSSTFSGVSVIKQTPAKNKQTTAISVSQKTAPAGSEILFVAGNSLNFFGNPKSTRYSWNMGDGNFKRGGKVTHIYEYPGTYVVVLKEKVDRNETTKTININILPAEDVIVISNVSTGRNGFIELSNTSAYQLDISKWIVSSSGKQFEFPEHSYLASKGKIKISAKTLNISISLPVTLLRYDKKTATSFTHLASLGAVTSSSQKFESDSTKAPLLIVDEEDFGYQEEPVSDIEKNYISQVEQDSKVSWWTISWIGVLVLILGGAIASVFLMKSSEEFDIIEDN